MTKKRSRILPAILAFMLAVMPSGCALLPSEEELVAPPLKEPAKVTYDTVTVEKQPDVSYDFTKIGSFQSNTNQDAYYTLQSGKLAKMYVRANDTVKKGDIIAELENDSIQTSIDKQKLTMQSLKIDLDAAKALADGGGSIAKQKANIDIYNQKLVDLQADYQDAVNTSNETNKDKIKQQMVDQQNTIDLAMMDYNSALKSAKDAYQKSLINYQLNQEILTTYQKQLDACLLKAPCSGLVTFVKGVNVGDTIQPYDTIASISDPNDLMIEVNSGTDGKDLLQTGVKLNISITDQDTGTKTTYPGKVTRTFAEMTPAEQEQAGAPDVVFIKLDKNPSGIKIGMTATLTLRVWDKKDVIAIDTYLVNTTEAPSRYTVSVLENNIPVERAVIPAKDAHSNILTNATMMVIDSGLEVGDQVIK